MDENEILLRLILGNVNDEVALRNICEVHLIDPLEITPEEEDFLIATNNFYYSVEEFNTLHHEKDDVFFQSLINDGTIAAASNGYVWINCV